jgi:hypothetical protein
MPGTCLGSLKLPTLTHKAAAALKYSYERFEQTTSPNKPFFQF